MSGGGQSSYQPYQSQGNYGYQPSYGGSYQDPQGGGNYQAFGGMPQGNPLTRSNGQQNYGDMSQGNSGMGYMGGGNQNFGGMQGGYQGGGGKGGQGQGINRFQGSTRPMSMPSGQPGMMPPRMMDMNGMLGSATPGLTVPPDAAGTYQPLQMPPTASSGAPNPSMSSGAPAPSMGSGQSQPFSDFYANQPPPQQSMGSSASPQTSSSALGSSYKGGQQTAYPDIGQSGNSDGNGGYYNPSQGQPGMAFSNPNEGLTAGSGLLGQASQPQYTQGNDVSQWQEGQIAPNGMQLVRNPQTGNLEYGTAPGSNGGNQTQSMQSYASGLAAIGQRHPELAGQNVNLMDRNVLPELWNGNQYNGPIEHPDYQGVGMDAINAGAPQQNFTGQWQGHNYLNGHLYAPANNAGDASWNYNFTHMIPGR